MHKEALRIPMSPRPDGRFGIRLVGKWIVNWNRAIGMHAVHFSWPCGQRLRVDVPFPPFSAGEVQHPILTKGNATAIMVVCFLIGRGDEQCFQRS